MGCPASDSPRFAALARLYGADAPALLAEMHVCVVGIGGVGSWALEALARSGIGELTFIDGDTVCPTNVNRQLPALTDTFGRPKVEVMAERIAGIHPDCRLHPVRDYLTERNLEKLVTPAFDYVIDAIDSIRFKAALVHFCRRRKIPVVMTGGAGGLMDPTRIEVADLTRTWNDPLAAKVRARLRSRYGYTRNPKRRFGIECVFSTEQPRYPRADGSVGHEKPGIHGVSLDCRLGYGSTATVTATFGMIAASRAINRGLELKRRKKELGAGN
ncbi:MAG: tRNA cyclic N6-threonylcarbamoyladenosine(37) synthase TcdA [Gammaproteobacteria bacterium]|nr:MAG: tRNA cyclic N6-threonylcarbamoyladenosine(37) synthase TcdA [Gammaproteobacteria bacterium]